MLLIYLPWAVANIRCCLRVSFTEHGVGRLLMPLPAYASLCVVFVHAEVVVADVGFIPIWDQQILNSRVEISAQASLIRVAMPLRSI